MDQSYPKITLETIRLQNLGSLLIKWSQSNFNLRSSDSDLVLTSYLINTALLATSHYIPALESENTPDGRQIGYKWAWNWNG